MSDVPELPLGGRYQRPVRQQVYRLGGRRYDIIQQWDDFGNFRLILRVNIQIGFLINVKYTRSPWTSYTGIAIVKGYDPQIKQDVRFLGTSPYYSEHSYLPCVAQIVLPDCVR